MDKNWMNNKTVIITGASGGMGKGVAERLIKEHGCTVIGIARSEEKMKKVVEELGDYADKFSYQLFDVAVEKNWLDFVDYLNENNIKPDILINNAGILPKFDRFQNYTVEYIEKAMNINFYSAVYSIHALLPLLLESPAPAIINVDSSAALMTLAGTSMYSASKAALIGFTKALAKELGPSNITVNCICPGVIATDMNSVHSEETIAQLREETLLMRIGKPEDVANLAFFISGEEASFITGQVISVDGGFAL